MTPAKAACFFFEDGWLPQLGLRQPTHARALAGAGASPCLKQSASAPGLFKKKTSSVFISHYSKEHMNKNILFYKIKKTGILQAVML